MTADVLGALAAHGLSRPYGSREALRETFVAFVAFVARHGH